MNPLIPRALILLSLAPTGHAQVPQLINYQGRVTVNGQNFKGSGQFKFSIVDVAGTTSHWSNDGTSTAGSEPVAAVTLTVTKGLYSVLLGDTTLPNMAAIPTGLVINSNVRLRVWFNDGTNSSQLLTPDQQLATPHAGQLRNDGATATGDLWQQRATGGPPRRAGQTAIWTGSEMIVWGGTYVEAAGVGHLMNDGARYNPTVNSWATVTTAGAPVARSSHTAVWTGSEMIVWGGSAGSNLPLNDGGRYSPTGNSWLAVTTTDAPAMRSLHTAVWTGSEMIVWGGSPQGSATLNNGGRYVPAENSWRTVTTTGAPAGRYRHTAVWTGSEMIVWGGSPKDSVLNTGGRYSPAGNSWTAVSTVGAPGVRAWHTAVWTGSEMIVWGGNPNPNGVTPPTNDGGRYNPVGDSWAAVTTAGAPAGRDFQSTSAVWTGTEMIVWGGRFQVAGVPYNLNDGGRYNPVGDSWVAMSTTGAPAGRGAHTTVWTGREVIVWGGSYGVAGGSGVFPDDTFSYTPDCSPFLITSVVFESGNLAVSFPSVTGRKYSLWRSDTLTGASWTNTGLTALPGTGATLTLVVPVGTPANRFFRVHSDP